MANVLILGASGQIARLVTQQLLKETQHHLSLFCRNIKSLNIQQDNHIHLFGHCCK
ncbi:hypothetical protein P255_02799 [Acinetobacter brisouii CIP 110357]|uniref:NAD(P)-binding domain-containing protein n=1 Tax=Acinetobacter brisouii CIP 110357 TaxID=1341683 RepID=V2UK93_9GAMM|nr:hypothetical protein F954_00067 [Acinetobacter brisouii ANC 4119]ESK49060.1 hypothetical protein P255_02799 [Acinetobacter brisouii CIP 110357]